MRRERFATWTGRRFEHKEYLNEDGTVSSARCKCMQFAWMDIEEL